MIKKILALALLAISTESIAADVPAKDIAKCAAIEGDLARLECFDDVAKQHQLNGPQSQSVSSTGSGNWIVSVDINPVDDSKTVVLLNLATSGKGRFGEKISALIRCKSNQTDFYINWKSYLGEEASVLSRVGTAKAETSDWDVSTDSKSTFHPAPIPFIKSLLASDKLVLQVTPYGESPVTAIFDTAGLGEAIKPLRETCKW